jgi:hypothetical protein
MATRSIIKFEGTKVVVYKHWDGSPASTLPWLEKFNSDFAKFRGDDPEYKVAQLLRDSVRSGDEFHLDSSPFTGWGVYMDTDGNIDMDQDYTYILKTDGKVLVKSS